MRRKKRFRSALQHDFFAGEWKYTCRSCDHAMYGPTKEVVQRLHFKHTRLECLNGW